MIVITIRSHPILAWLHAFGLRFIISFLLVVLWVLFYYLMQTDEYESALAWNSLINGVSPDQVRRFTSGASIWLLIIAVFIIYKPWWCSDNTLPRLQTTLSILALCWLIIAVIYSMHLIFGAPKLSPNILSNILNGEFLETTYAKYQRLASNENNI